MKLRCNFCRIEEINQDIILERKEMLRHWYEKHPSVIMQMLKLAKVVEEVE
jgi:hypothetical protein